MFEQYNRKNITLEKCEAGKIRDTMVITGITQESQMEFL
jgi:hypothetical protein